MEILLGTVPYEEVSEVPKIVLGSSTGEPIGAANRILYNTLGVKFNKDGFYPEYNIVYVNMTRHSWDPFTPCEVRDAFKKAREILLENKLQSAAFAYLPEARGLNNASQTNIVNDIFHNDKDIQIYKESVGGLSKSLACKRRCILVGEM